MAAHRGLIATSDWVTDQRPKSYREGIKFLYPNGMLTLTGITSMMQKEKVDDSEYNWWTESLPAQRTSGTAGSFVYKDADLQTAYSGDSYTSGQTVYLKSATAEAEEFRAGHVLKLRDADDYTHDCVGRVTGITAAASGFYSIAVKLLEDDPDDFANNDVALIIGSAQAEGGSMPTAVAYQPTKITNYTQTFEVALNLTRRAIRTRLRTGDAYKNERTRCLRMLGVEMEKAFIHGVPTETTDSETGDKITTTAGLIYMIETYASANVNDFSLNTTYSGQTWEQGGEEWLDSYLRLIFKYGATEKLCICGSAALHGINRLAKATGWIRLEPTSTSYGLKVKRWEAPFGVVDIKTHPLLSHEATDANSMIIFEPSGLRYRYVDDVTFLKDTTFMKGGKNASHRKYESWFADCGLEYYFAEGWGYLNGVGLDSAV